MIKSFLTLGLLALLFPLPGHAEMPPAVEETVVKNYFSSLNLSQNHEAAQSSGIAKTDLNGDEKEEIILVWTTLGPTYSHNTLTVFSQTDKGYEPAATHQLLGEAALASVQDGVITIDQVIHAKNDPVCCPTIKTQMKYRWDKNKISEIK